MAAMARPRSVEPVPAFVTAFGEARSVLPGAGDGGIARLREESFERFRAAGVPTPRTEAWKYTNLAKLANLPMALAPRAAVGPNEIGEHTAGGPKARRIIFVNGHVVLELSHVASLPAGVRVTSLGRAIQEMPDRVRAALAETADDGRSFTALNAAFAASGAWIEVEDGAALEEPLQLLFLTVGQPAPVMAHPRNVVRVGAGGRLRLIESHVVAAGGGGGGGGPDAGPNSLTNLVTQIRLGDRAEVDHDRLQLHRDGSSHVGKAFIELGSGARYRQTVATLGGTLVRNESDVRLLGDGAECVLNGAYMPRGKEHVDNVIRINHERPNGRSDQFYKGVVDGEAHAVFAGKIIVHQVAQKTNAYQKNDNLLLSDDAEIDTKPELEIYADDVKCSHGATVGDLDPKALFYLRSRGFDRATAASVLTFAFAAEVFGRFADDTVRRQARAAAAARLPGGAALAELV
jgi:Fe-S cluster assembly protein SufD